MGGGQLLLVGLQRPDEVSPSMWPQTSPGEAWTTTIRLRMDTKRLVECMSPHVPPLRTKHPGKPDARIHSPPVAGNQIVRDRLVHVVPGAPGCDGCGACRVAIVNAGSMSEARPILGGATRRSIR